MPLDIGTSEFRYLETFILVAEEGTFSAAGRKLGISGNAVGQAIRQFEQRLGLQLFVRTTRAVVLTEQGRRLAENIKPAAIALTDAIATAKSSQDSPAGIVRICAGRAAVEQVFLPMLPAFARQYPAIDVDITISDAQFDILSDGFDVGLMIGEVVTPDLVAVKIGPDRRQLAVATPEFIDRFGRPKHPRDLVNFSCLRWRWFGESRSYDWEFMEDGSWFSVKVPGPILLTDRQLLLRLCLDHVGICLTAEVEVRELIEAGVLVNLLDQWCAPFPGWHLCFSKQRFVPRPLRLFIDAVRAFHGGAEAGLR